MIWKCGPDGIPEAHANCVSQHGACEVVAICSCSQTRGSERQAARTNYKWRKEAAAADEQRQQQRSTEDLQVCGDESTSCEVLALSRAVQSKLCSLKGEASEIAD